ncbi:hypothetical protein BSKO_07239 [Bryopsis sp. KO-2023]|nr:hypothetical protein BSKO_07239 [Bryopsis sp. KO-2023]
MKSDECTTNAQSGKRKKCHVDWDGLHSLAESGDIKNLLDKIEEWMRMSKAYHFRYMRDGIQKNCLLKMEPMASANLIVEAIKYLTTQDPAIQYVTLLSHLFIELVAETFDDQIAGEMKHVTSELFVSLSTPQRSRLAAKVAVIFQLKIEDVPADFDLVDYIASLFEDPNTYTPAVGLLQHFPSLTERFDLKPIFSKLLLNGHESLGEKWAGSLDRIAKIDFVEECLASRKMKTASSAVRWFGLLVEYPHVERLYKEATVAKLIDKALWGPALTMVGEDKKLQEKVIREIAAAGNVSMAQQYQRLYQLPESIVDIDPEVLAAEAALRASKYMQLGIPMEKVMFVDTPEKALAAGEALGKADIVGIDVEWKPEQKGKKSKASILQAGIRDDVFIFDLLAIGECPELSAALLPCLQSADVTILGFGINEDLSKLTSSYPSQPCFKSVEQIVDLQQVWRPYAAKNNIQIVSGRQNVGLSSTVERILGKPVDKSMQVSNWEARPLSLAQIKYAAQDAHILLLLYDKMIGGDGDGSLGPGSVEELKSTYHHGGPGPTKQESFSLQSADPFDGSSFGRGQKGFKKNKVPCRGRQLSRGKFDDKRNADVFDFGEIEEERSSPPQRIATRLEQCGLSTAFQWLETDEDKSTAEGAASALGVEVSRIAKSVALSIKRTHWLVVLRGDRQVDLNKVATITGFKRRRVRIAHREECIKVFGYEPGTLPPFGHVSPDVGVLVDPMLQESPSQKLYCGSGTPHGVVGLSYKELLEVSQGSEADVTLTTTDRSSSDSGDEGGDSEEEFDVPRKTSVRFFLDSMLGRLCRWLRATGVDAEYLTEEEHGDDIPMIVKKATKDGRVFLTRNYKLAMRKDCAMVFLLGSSSCEDQMREVASHFGIR